MRAQCFSNNECCRFRERCRNEICPYSLSPLLNLGAVLANHPKPSEELRMRHQPLEAAYEIPHVRGF